MRWRVVVLHGVPAARAFRLRRRYFQVRERSAPHPRGRPGHYNATGFEEGIYAGISSSFPKPTIRQNPRILHRRRPWNWQVCLRSSHLAPTNSRLRSAGGQSSALGYSYAGLRPAHRRGRGPAFLRARDSSFTPRVQFDAEDARQMGLVNRGRCGQVGRSTTYVQGFTRRTIAANAARLRSRRSSTSSAKSWKDMTLRATRPRCAENGWEQCFAQPTTSSKGRRRLHGKKRKPAYLPAP